MTTIAEQLERMAAHNRVMFPSPPSKVQIQRAGGYYKARYAGQAACCFGNTPTDAKKRLEILPRGASMKLKFACE